MSMESSADIVKSATEAKSILSRPVLNFEDRVRLAQLLRNLLDDGTITHANVFEGSDVTFMAKFFPGERYLQSPVSQVRYGHAIASACKGDIKSVLTEAMTDFCGKLIRPRSSVAATKPESNEQLSQRREGDKKEIRRLVVKRVVHHARRGPDLDEKEIENLSQLLSKHSRKRKIDTSSCDAAGLRFLQKYYPEDHARVVKIRNRIRHRQGGPFSANPSKAPTDAATSRVPQPQRPQFSSKSDKS